MGGGAAGQEEARQEESYSPFLVGLGEDREGERGKEKGGAAPLSLSYSD